MAHGLGNLTLRNETLFENPSFPSEYRVEYDTSSTVLTKSAWLPKVQTARNLRFSPDAANRRKVQPMLGSFLEWRRNQPRLPGPVLGQFGAVAGLLC